LDPVGTAANPLRAPWGHPSFSGLKSVIRPADILREPGRTVGGALVTGGHAMQADDFLNIINECDVLRDDIDDLRGRVQFTRGEVSKLDQAVAGLDKVKSILSHLFPAIASLDEGLREDLQSELSEPE